jgi:hypothetical protein
MELAEFFAIIIILLHIRIIDLSSKRQDKILNGVMAVLWVVSLVVRLIRV